MGVINQPNLKLETINLALLESSDYNERQRLVQACKDQGFLYLDLASDPHLVEDWETTLDFMAKYFAKDTEEKMKDSFQSDTYGYVDYRISNPLTSCLLPRL